MCVDDHMGLQGFIEGGGGCPGISPPNESFPPKKSFSNN